MDLGLSEEQEMLRTSARDFLQKECPKQLVKQLDESDEGYSPELWRKMAELGWMGLVLPEEYGGSGGSFLDLVVLLEEMGYNILPGPFFSTVVLGGLSILAAGNEEQKKRLLPEVANGSLLLTLALTESDAQFNASSVKTDAIPSNEGWLVSGTKLFVTDAHVAQYIICPAQTSEGISLFLVDADSPGISRTLLKTLAGDKQCEVVLDKVKVPRQNLLGEGGQGWDYIENVFSKMVIAKCGEMIGGAQRVFEMAADYAKERKQFGRPIGSFQAIQHYCANMAIDVEGARLITYQAAWLLSEGLPCTMETSVAKAWVGEAYHRITMLAAQIHGSIGLTVDHDFPLYYKRAKIAELFFGSPDFHREIVAHMAGL